MPFWSTIAYAKDINYIYVHTGAQEKGLEEYN